VSFYVYLYFRPDGTPYYVGKGSGSRATVNHDRRKKKLVPIPSKDRIHVYECTSESEAFEIEKHLISQYGRKDQGTGCLINLTNGGEGGASGKIVSMEVRAKISATLKAKSTIQSAHAARGWTSERKERFKELRKTWNTYPKAA